jgi:hypothetical protein
MTENFTPSPEAHFLADKQHYVNSLTLLVDAAERLWHPTDEVDTFTYDTSAAGDKLRSTLNPTPEGNGPAFTITVEDISRRFKRALEATLGPVGFVSRVSFEGRAPVDDPNRPYSIVMLLYDPVTQEDTPTYDADLTQAEFAAILEAGGLAEKASISQRLGRRALNAMAWLVSGQQYFVDEDGRTHYPLP